VSEFLPLTAARRPVSALAAAGLLLLAACARDSSEPADWQQYATQRQHEGEERLEVKVEYGAGRFNVERAESRNLYSVDMRYDAAIFRPTAHYADGRLRVSMEGSGRVRGRSLGDGYLRLALNPDVPTSLDLQFGAVVAEIELGGMMLTDVSLQTGASETTVNVSAPNRVPAARVNLEAGAARFHARQLGNLNAQAVTVNGGVGNIVLDFSGEWSQDMTANISVGVGTLTIVVPRGLGVEVRRSGVLSGFDGQELVRRGDAYYSADWDVASRRLSINLNAAIGRVRVSWTDGPGPVDSGTEGT
jgi:hypothetical protein